ncbi:MAG TPA: HAMP domain-containing sensor histidine kinase [Solirubrobacterales bacterium]|nr:HAMP domain-containing sensor histidine kinase [Solirubrobacterales bacterium]
MSFNPSLTARLRIGFLVLFALLLIVSLLGVGRLFQIRVDYENDITRYFQLELQSERLRSAFILEQAAARPATAHQTPSQAELDQAAASFSAAATDARKETADDPVLTTKLNQLVAAESAWRKVVAEPLIHEHVPPPPVDRRLTSAVTNSGEELANDTRAARDSARDNARADTRNTTILVAAGLGGALLAALLLFSGLINSMRAPLGRLVEGARRLAGGDLRTRVEVGGPVEIATLGRAFNEMANSLERDARERDRVERMKDDFVLTVSHELRTPVTVVKGFAEMLTAQRKSLNTRQFEAAEVIAESAGQLQKMINDLLDLARSDAGKLRIEPESTPVRPLAQRIGRQMRPNFESKDQRFTVSVEKDLPDIQADAGRIGQVLANLLTNANKYAPEGSEVQLAATQVGDEVEFAVSDTGPGLDQDQLDHVFDRFWRADSSESQSVGGTGLGLAIAKSLVELHGGAISANSSPGEGATFRFVLPIAKDGRPKQKTPADRTKAGAAG